MRRIAVTIVILLLAAACSSDGGTTRTTSPAGGTATETTTTLAATTTQAVPETTTTTTAAASSGLASCVVGVWELDSETFLAAVADEAGDAADIGEFQFGGGSYRLTVGADGTFVDERIDWTLLVVSDLGDLAVTINDRNEGTYTLEGDTLSTSIDTGDPPEVTFLVDGVPLEFPAGASPVQPPSAEFTGATVTCAGDAMSAFFDGFTSTWARTG